MFWKHLVHVSTEELVVPAQAVDKRLWRHDAGTFLRSMNLSRKMVTVVWAACGQVGACGMANAWPAFTHSAVGAHIVLAA
eukprot:365282-Chlamydomonas_euryale.AAC.11